MQSVLKMKANDLVLYFLLWWVLPLMVAVYTYGNFRKRKKNWKYLPQFFRHWFICIAAVKWLQSSRFFQTILSNSFHWIAFAQSKRSLTCYNCGTQTKKPNIARHKKICSVWTLFCTQCPNCSTKSQELNYLSAKNYSAPKPAVIFKCKLCYQNFPGFNALHQHENTKHGFPIKTANVDLDNIIN